jgi:hypothetical protein
VAQFSVGDVSVRRGAASQPLSKGQPIDSGDNIVTGSSGQTQIRFSDGGLVSLSPNSQFNINKYVDDNDPDKDSFAVSFLRGSMRAITGLIGKRNRDNYKVTTNTATIGIRGSAFSARHNPDGSLDVAGEQDAIEVCTNAGCVSLIVGEIVRVTGADSLPSRTAQRSNVPPLVARDDLFVPENPADVRQVALPTLLNGEITGLSAMFAFGDDGIDYYLRGGQDPSDGVGTFSAGQLVRHEGSYGNYMQVVNGSGLAIVEKTSTGPGTFGTIGSASDPGLIGWGYWDEGTVRYPGLQNPTVLAENEYPFTGVHYIVGRPTPQALMPATSTATYTLVPGTRPEDGSLLGGTRPTAYDYESSTLRVGTLVDASLTVNFQTSRVVGLVNTSFTVGTDTIAVQVYDVGSVDGATFASDGCGNGQFRGFFTGAQASRAGMVYGAYDDTVGYVRGSAVFLKTGTEDVYTSQSGLAAMFVSGDGGFFDYSPRGSDDSEQPSSALFLGSQLYDHDDNIHPTRLSTESPVMHSGALGVATDADFIGWGYWANGQRSGYSYSYFGSSSLADVHYLVGRPTPQNQMPGTGTATYTLHGGTAPTASDSGTTIVGRLVGASLSADFGAGMVSATVNTEFSKNNTIVPVVVTDMASISGSRFTSTGCSQGEVNGFFSGNLAARAGLIYRTTGTAVGQVSGAAVFTRSSSSGLAVAPP